MIITITTTSHLILDLRDIKSSVSYYSYYSNVYLANAIYQKDNGVTSVTISNTIPLPLSRPL